MSIVMHYGFGMHCVKDRWARKLRQHSRYISEQDITHTAMHANLYLFAVGEFAIHPPQPEHQCYGKTPYL